MIVRENRAMANAGYEEFAAKVTPDAVQARIKQLRMGTLTVQAKPGAQVEVRQVRHEFLFGTAIPNEVVKTYPKAMPAEDRKQYIKILGENFNYAVHENALKWYDIEKEEGAVDYSVADGIWDICKELGIPMRGHCIFWEKDDYIQPWLKALNNDKLRAAVVRRGLGVTSHYKGRISEFDLNNEMIHGDFFRRRLGYGIINEMALLAKTGNPDAVLYVNDYGILVEGGFNAGSYLWQIQNLLDNGVPIGGIGCQGHSGTNMQAPMSPVTVQRNLDRLSRFNLPIKITECLFDAGDEDFQAEEMRKIFPIYFAHPKVEAILMWGFWESAHWHPYAAMWRKDWTPTPQGKVYQDFLFNTWWTKASGKADKAGAFQTDAFFGDYEIVSGGKTLKVSLGKKDKTIEVDVR